MGTEITKIRRVDALREYDIKSDRAGRQVVFEIAFVLKSGEWVFLPRAVATGLPWSLKDTRQRGVRAVDKKGDPIGHIYPVRIDNIMKWNGKRVML
jgi:hypothetical protein